MENQDKNLYHNINENNKQDDSDNFQKNEIGESSVKINFGTVNLVNMNMNNQENFSNSSEKTEDLIQEKLENKRKLKNKKDNAHKDKQKNKDKTKGKKKHKEKKIEME